MGRPRKFNKPPKQGLTNENLALSLSIVRQVYKTLDEAKEALAKHDEIPYHKKRYLFEVELGEETLYLIGYARLEVCETVLLQKVGASVEKYRERRVDPVSIQREKLNKLETAIEEKKRFLDLLGDTDDPRLNEVRRVVTEELAGVQAQWAALADHILHISSLSPELADKADKRDRYKIARAGKDLPESDPVFLAPPQPPIEDEVYEGPRV